MSIVTLSTESRFIGKEVENRINPLAIAAHGEKIADDSLGLLFPAGMLPQNSLLPFLLQKFFHLHIALGLGTWPKSIIRLLY